MELEEERDGVFVVTSFINQWEHDARLLPTFNNFKTGEGRTYYYCVDHLSRIFDE